MVQGKRVTRKKCKHLCCHYRHLTMMLMQIIKMIIIIIIIIYAHQHKAVGMKTK